MAYPTEINNLIDVVGTDTLAAAGHAQRHNDANTALESVRDFLNGGDEGTILVSNGSASAPSFVPMTGRRNLLYNGDMQIAQRSASVTSITGNGYYTADRWFQNFGAGGGGTWTQTVENDAPTGSGFRKSVKYLVTTASASPASNEACVVGQRLEGFDMQAIKKGTSEAESLTLSLWVKSNVTGTYRVWFQDNDNSRHIVGSYTIDSSGTWERKTITIPGDTTGVLDNDANGSFTISNFLVAGSDYAGGTLATSWAATVAANAAVGQVNVAAATNNYFQMTGWQLEVGSQSTAFEHKPFGESLRECQRYYQKSYDYGTAPGTATANGSIAFTVMANSTTSLANNAVGFQFFERMRAQPTVTTFLRGSSNASGSVTYAKAATAAVNIPSVVTAIGESGAAQVYGTGSSLTPGDAVELLFHYTAQAEL